MSEKADGTINIKSIISPLVVYAPDPSYTSVVNRTFDIDGMYGDNDTTGYTVYVVATQGTYSESGNSAVNEGCWTIRLSILSPKPAGVYTLTFTVKRTSDNTTVVGGGTMTVEVRDIPKIEPIEGGVIEE